MLSVMIVMIILSPCSLFFRHCFPLLLYPLLLPVNIWHSNRTPVYLIHLSLSKFMICSVALIVWGVSDSILVRYLVRFFVCFKFTFTFTFFIEANNYSSCCFSLTLRKLFLFFWGGEGMESSWTVIFMMYYISKDKNSIITFIKIADAEFISAVKMQTFRLIKG